MIPVLLAATTTTISNPAAEAINDLTNLDQACGTDPSWACRWIYDLTGSDSWAGVADWVLAKPLAQADLGIAMGSGTDVAAASADLVLMRSEVGAIAQGIGLSRATLRIIKQNLAWAFGYNTAAIPLAMAGLLNPMIAGGAMALSSVLVVSNSLRLRRYGR